MIPRALSAWGDLRGAMRVELTEVPPDGRLLGYLMVALLVNWVSAIPLRLKDAGADPEASIGMGFVATLFMAPLLFYGIAVLMTWSARIVGGKAGHYEHRLALFWGFLVATPAAVLANVVENLSGTHLAIDIARGACAVWVLGACMAEANGYRFVWHGMAQVLIPSAALVALSALARLL